MNVHILTLPQCIKVLKFMLPTFVMNINIFCFLFAATVILQSQIVHHLGPGLHGERLLPQPRQRQEPVSGPERSPLPPPQHHPGGCGQPRHQVHRRGPQLCLPGRSKSGTESLPVPLFKHRVSCFDDTPALWIWENKIFTIPDGLPSGCEGCGDWCAPRNLILATGAKWLSVEIKYENSARLAVKTMTREFSRTFTTIWNVSHSTPHHRYGHSGLSWPELLL